MGGAWGRAPLTPWRWALLPGAPDLSLGEALGSAVQGTRHPTQNFVPFSDIFHNSKFYATLFGHNSKFCATFFLGTNQKNLCHIFLGTTQKIVCHIFLGTTQNFMPLLSFIYLYYISFLDTFFFIKHGKKLMQGISRHYWLEFCSHRYNFSNKGFQAFNFVNKEIFLHDYGVGGGEHSSENF